MTTAAQRTTAKKGGKDKAAQQQPPPAPSESQGNGSEAAALLPVNSPDVADLVRTVMKGLQECDVQAQAINAQRKKLREQAAAAGLNRHAIAFAKRLYEMDDIQRRSIALSLGISLAALDLPPVQTELDVLVDQDGPDGDDPAVH